jgi:tetratricopeptide (TPR) repeat protein
VRRGLGHAGTGARASALRRTLGAAEDADDRELARRLVSAAARASLLDLHAGEPEAPRKAAPLPADGSFLGRLAVQPGEDRPCIPELDDVRTLLAVVRGGSLQQRRAAALRLRMLLERGDLDDAAITAIENVLSGHRDADVAFEIGRARAALPGEIGDEARDEEEPWSRVATELEHAVTKFWEGESAAEPFAELPGEQRAWIAIRARLLPERVIAHVSAVLEGGDGASEDPERRALLEAIRHAGDPRLLPSLVSLLASRRPELVADAARALARIDDPRVIPALLGAYERSVLDPERAVIAGALGLAGDPRGLPYLRKLLRGDDPRVRLAAAEAMEAVATSEDVELLIGMLERTDLALVGLVVRALGRIGDGRALRALDALSGQERLPSALRGEIEDAVLAIRAQLELRGEEPPLGPEPSSPTSSSLVSRARANVVAQGPEEGFWARVRGQGDFFLGRLWMALGAASRAVAWFELAAARRPRWPAPLAAIALAHVKLGEPARALGAFRRAIEADREWVERERPVVRTLAQVVLRRAEEMERSGRLDVARGLLEEVLELDLRRVPSNTVFELRRRRRALTTAIAPEAA